MTISTPKRLLWECEVLAQFSRIVYQHPLLQYVNIKHLGNRIQAAFISDFPPMRNLLKLHLRRKCDNDSSLQFTDFSRLTFTKPCYKSFERMEQLSELSLIGCCTNDILKSVSKGCPLLAFLDIRNSVLVNDNGCRFLGSLRILSTLKAANTNISPHNIARIAFELPIKDLGPCSESVLVSIFDILSQTTNKTVHVEKIAFPKSTEGCTMNNLRLLKCMEKLSSLHVHLPKGNEYSTPSGLSTLIQQLNNLKELIISCHHTCDVTGILLRTILTHETQEHISSLDISSYYSPSMPWSGVMDVLYNVPNLTSLAIAENNSNWSYFTRSDPPECFSHLTKLKISIKDTGVDAFKYLLSHVNSLERLEAFGAGVVLPNTFFDKFLMQFDHSWPKSLTWLSVEGLGVSYEVFRMFLCCCLDLKVAVFPEDIRCSYFEQTINRSALIDQLHQEFKKVKICDLRVVQVNEDEDY